ncbi:MAG: hypothetical protein ACJA2Y_001298 [Cycloclasticus pugetii]|jgi:hypothetical protein|uniref:Uncharacterized protein n=2 Tax=Piscirickettsiaceae TaxID=135616 RepID=S5T8P4_9GAMM|nr:hypothetical protein CYCME_1826 [Cycloclasticus zancles 78-ME]
MGVFDHSVFEPIGVDGHFTAERERMWALHEKHVTSGMAPGAVYMSNPIMTSGHPTYLTRLCDYYAQIIRNNDPMLDERHFINDLYGQGGLSHPDKYNFEWRMDSLDLGLLDKKNDVFFSIHKGHM